MTTKKTIRIKKPKIPSSPSNKPPTPPAIAKRPVTDTSKTLKVVDEFETYWRKKADQLRDRFEQNLCIRTLDSRIKPIALDLIQSYCNTMRTLERHLSNAEIISADYRIAALHSVLTAINVIQADLSGVDDA